MTIQWQEQLRPGAALKGIVQQATAALIAMDAERLEELAKCCIDLNRELEQTGSRTSASAKLQIPNLQVADLQGVVGDLELLKCVLFETRANLSVLTHLHTIRLREAFTLANSTPPRGGEAAAKVTGIWSWPERQVEYGDN